MCLSTNPLRSDGICQCSISGCKRCDLVLTVETCTECDSDYLKDGQCVASCGDGYYSVSSPIKQCIPCGTANCKF